MFPSPQRDQLTTVMRNQHRIPLCWYFSVNSEVRLTQRGAYADIFALLAHYHRTNANATLRENEKQAR